MTSQEYLQELAQLLQRMARLQQEYAEICMQEAADIQYKLLIGGVAPIWFEKRTFSTQKNGTARA